MTAPVLNPPVSKMWRRLLWAVIALILITPVIYWLTGIGQSAASLSSEVTRLADGTLVSSPKAEARHALLFPLSLQRMLMYPLLLLAFQLSGGAVALRRWLESRFATLRGLWLDIAVIGGFVVALNLALFTLYLPLNFYRSFIVGHQFGLSTQSALGWLSDWGISVGINLLTDGLLWTALYLLMLRVPRQWPVWAGAGLAVFSIGYTLLSPLVITPLFYEVSPLDNEALRQRMLTLSEEVGMPVENVYVIDASAKTTAVNAYVTSFGAARRMVFYDTLLDGYSLDEIEVVLVHELGHWYYGHVFWSVIGLAVLGWLALFGLRWLLDRVWRPLGLRSAADVAGLPFLLAIIYLASLLAMPIENSVSRYAENQADEFALNVSQKPEAFATLFERLAEQNLSIVSPPTWEKIIFYTHPPISERINRAENFEPPLVAD